MSQPKLIARCAILCVALTAGFAARADDLDALSLESAPQSERPTTDRPVRLVFEAGIGRNWGRAELPNESTRRLGVDYSQRIKFGDRWNAVLSDRLDHARPARVGSTDTLNSLREAYVGWRGEFGDDLVEVGRINLRIGPAYGYNPTDYFRTGALRTVSTVDPMTLRETRMGTVMLRAQRLLPIGALSLALAPKLGNAPSAESLSLDLGSTNRRSRGLISWSPALNDRVSGQLLVFGEEGRKAQFGTNLTALVSDAAVAHLEWSAGRDQDLLAVAQGRLGAARTSQRLSVGLTYTVPTKLAITAEIQYNGFAATTNQLRAMGIGTPEALGSYLLAAQDRQDNAARQALLIYASQRGIGIKNLDLTALLRFNADDHSRLGWIELRHHWSGFDLALQVQSNQGSAATEYGFLRSRSSIQMLGDWYF